MSGETLAIYLKIRSIISRNLEATLTSITLSGAILWNLARLYGENVLKGVLEEFQGGVKKAPFAVGDPSLAAKTDKGFLRFYRVPSIIRLVKTGGIITREEYRARKTMKKAKYITEGVLANYINRNASEFVESLNKYPGEKEVEVKKGIIMMKNEEEQLVKLSETDPYATYIEPHTAINRLTGGALSGTLHNLEKMSFADYIYIWFPLYINPETNYKREIRQAARMISVFGFGGRKSVGQGVGEATGEPFVEEEWPPKTLTNGKNEYIYLLSHITLYPPKNLARCINLEESFYKTAGRLGVTESARGFMLKKWYMTIKSGSLIKTIGDSDCILCGDICVLGSPLCTVEKHDGCEAYDIAVGLGLKWG